MTESSAPMVVENASRYSQVGDDDLMLGVLEITATNDLAFDYAGRAAALAQCTDSATHAVEDLFKKSSVIDIQRRQNFGDQRIVAQPIRIIQVMQQMPDGAYLFRCHDENLTSVCGLRARVGGQGVILRSPASMPICPLP